MSDLSKVRRALEEIADRLNCRGDKDLDHYCPNCDNSLFAMRALVDEALSSLPAIGPGTLAAIDQATVERCVNVLAFLRILSDDQHATDRQRNTAHRAVELIQELTRSLTSTQAGGGDLDAEFEDVKRRAANLGYTLIGEPQINRIEEAGTFDDGIEAARKYVAHNPYPGSMFILANAIESLKGQPAPASAPVGSIEDGSNLAAIPRAPAASGDGWMKDAAVAVLDYVHGEAKCFAPEIYRDCAAIIAKHAPSSSSDVREALEEKP